MSGPSCLVTGATGFLGRHVVDALRHAGAEVTALSRTSSVDQCRTVMADLREPDLTIPGRFDVVYHAAGRAHTVARTPAEAKQFFDVNVEGLQHVLAALERTRRLPESFVLISSVAVYGRNYGELIDETSPRLAVDPYGCSKRIAEDVLSDWSTRRGVRCTIVRLPLVAGRNAPGNLGSMIRGLRARLYMGVGDGTARRSVVLAREVAAALPALALRGGTFHLTDGDHPTVAALERALTDALTRRPPARVPMRLARGAARVGDFVQHFTARPVPVNTGALNKLITTLTFSDARARHAVNWRPSRVVDHGRELL